MPTPYHDTQRGLDLIQLRGTERSIPGRLSWLRQRFKDAFAGKVEIVCVNEPVFATMTDALNCLSMRCRLEDSHILAVRLVHLPNLWLLGAVAPRGATLLPHGHGPHPVPAAVIEAPRA